ncbi:exodeoxyribonuclease III [Corynebacterium macclintockiae]|uniref:exodeoxyribonuclease III n=1 Tax=Corynebacterium macclintockiae TaxID=2913501 RepID=UPI00054E5ECA|nr:exodeoxyribonuclease III [Corynebacterium macclintockiae]MDK8890905.1 exodeoxyribonuclease III [Corynebacterium macclintockiae]
MKSLTIATVNVNGIRAAAKVRHEGNQGILPWLEATPADVVLMQEVRADEKQTRAALEPVLGEWHLAQSPAAAKGRAGVAILSRLPLRDVQIGFGGSAGAEEFADSGRYIEATVDAGDQPVRVASLYLPSGAAGTEKQDEKYRFLDSFGEYLQARAAQAEQSELPELVIGGDWNICHRREDLKNWKTNRKKSGFLPDERAFMDSLLGTFPDEATQVSDDQDAGRNGNPAGVAGDFFGAVEYAPGAAAQARLATGAAAEPHYFDVMRRVLPDQAGPYSWWTYRGQAFDTDAGWRIDLQVATKGMLDRALRANKVWVDKAAAYDQRWSDHSPVLVEYAC